jgi:hypothetical protein
MTIKILISYTAVALMLTLAASLALVTNVIAI